MSIDYKSAGVDIDKGDQFVDWLKEDQSVSPHQDKVLDGIGGFASIFRFNFPELKDPCLVSATDGIGTKLKLGIELESYESLGQDLVAMCANDLICTGASPLYFLDYFATSKLDLHQAQSFLKGVRKACHESQMALIGGETAEMPGLYQPKDFDCAGFAVGVVDREKILGPQNVKKGMVALGVSSSGFHSNGYSLVRKLFSTPDDLKKWGDALLTPTHLYIDLALKALKQSSVAAIAHITGGGIHNIARVIPKNLSLELKNWQWPELFKEAQRRAKITDAEMLKTFNCGVGLVFIIDTTEVNSLKSLIQNLGFQSYDLGVLVDGDQTVIIPEV